MLQNHGLQIKKKSTADSLRTVDVDENRTDINMIDAAIERAAAIKVVIIICVLIYLIFMVSD